MSATLLKSLLDEGRLTPGNVRRLAEASAAWCDVEANVATFVLRGLFAELAARWDDEQGAPTEEIETFESHLLIPLRGLLELLEAGNGKGLADALNHLAAAFRDGLTSA
jgi:hypothetical protein